MSNENPNSTPRWRDKLDELEHLPGSPFNGDAAWDKLYGRLRGNKKSKKVSWYWIAAACLLFGLMITLFYQHKDISQPANKETAIKQSKQADDPAVIDETSKDKKENAPVVTKDKVVYTPKETIQRNRHIIQTVVAPKDHDDIVTSDPVKGPAAKPLQIITTPSATAVVPPKKKLNVVHINELGDPIIETLDMTSKIGRHSFKLANEEIYVDPTVNKNSDFTILKTKL